MFNDLNLRNLNPVTQTSAHGDTSNRYRFVSTADIKASLEASGFTVWKEQVARVRKPDRQGYQKHTLKFFRTADADLMPGERPDQHVVRARSDAPAIPMLILTNSHDGKSGIVIHGGFFRVLCANGLVVSESDMPPVRIRHTAPQIMEKVYSETWRIVAELEQQVRTIEAMRGKALGIGAQLQFARQCLALLNQGEDIKAFEALEVKREGDKDADLWTVFNRVQEHVIKGGLKPEGGRRLREVKAIGREIDLNQQLWDIATSYLKAA
jgi:hypothetical protein